MKLNLGELFGPPVPEEEVERLDLESRAMVFEEVQGGEWCRVGTAPHFSDMRDGDTLEIWLSDGRRIVGRRVVGDKVVSIEEPINYSSYEGAKWVWVKKEKR